ncbi:SH3 domain-binding protein 5 homolog isoform X1 [Diorhabda carinulata]|uniref:SH3 domain-binding protein 5 homolog isoform X1 n=1 Tax=Diorhabda carinulata TaxID=1163345 RepID=UPI0025A014BA|nr:SH3 domain-binding protein 5 homolog isoform X1 [Diorhabda carinulata]XP_057672918.1 SH3 domain-binding protein 5 homolog isoform X1 [Diorhabda carinulata]
MENSDEETELDPRIQIELEKLNTTTDEINKLEIEYDEENKTFRMLLNDCTRRLKLLSKKIGSSIEKSRTYYELLEVAKKAQQECQEAAALYKKAHGIHAAAKETVALAERQFLTNQHEWQFDNAWQEMLNNATMKVMEAETNKAECGRDHQRKAAAFKEIEEKLKLEDEKFHKAILKARPYFDEKVVCQDQLNTQKNRIGALKQEILNSKQSYSQTLKNLEQISNEIHMKRQGKKHENDILRGPREPGVGAELTSNFEEVSLTKQYQSLPDIITELDKYDDYNSAVVSSTVSEKYDCGSVDNIDDVGSTIKKLELNKRSIEGTSQTVFVSEFHLGKLEK